MWDEIVTDVSECASVVSKKDDNSCSDNSSIKSGKLFAKLGKSSQSNDLDKSQSINEKSEPTAFNGLLIDVFIFIIKLKFVYLFFYLNDSVVNF